MVLSSPNVSHLSLQWLRDNFGVQVISQAGSSGQPHSSDLNQFDFFLWRSTKNTLYRDAPLTIDDLKRAIIQNTRVINQDKALFVRELLKTSQR